MNHPSPKTKISDNIHGDVTWQKCELQNIKPRINAGRELKPFETTDLKLAHDGHK